MGKLTKLLSITALAWSIGVSAEAESKVKQFQDVNSFFWGYNAIFWGIDHNIVSGYPDQTFKPNQSVKESEFLSMLLRYYANNTDKLIFEKGSSYWAESYYKCAKAYNLPISDMASNKLIKRGEVAKLIASSQGLNYNTNNAVQYLYNQEISNGRNGNKELHDFGKDSYLTRIEAIQFIKNLSDRKLTILKKRPVQPSTPLIEASTELVAFTEENGMIGFKDESGRILVDPQFSYGGSLFKEGLTSVYFNKKWGFIDSNGEIVIPLQFEEVRDFREGLAAVRVGNKYGFIDKTGKWVIPAQFNTVVFSEYSSELNTRDNVDFHEGFAVVKIGDKFGLINKAGKVVTTQTFDLINPVSEGMAVVHLRDKIGYINTSGKIVIKPQSFIIANDFHDGLAAVLPLNEKYSYYGYIDKTGQFVIKPQFSFDEILGTKPQGIYPTLPDFNQGFARVAIDLPNGSWEYYIIDKKGNKIKKVAAEPTEADNYKLND